MYLITKTIFRIYSYFASLVIYQKTDVYFDGELVREGREFVKEEMRSLKSLGRFPAAKGNRVKLKVSKANREKLKNLKSSLMLAMSEHKLE
ncbi:hypothetical protein BH23BAC3_BH23BAC3_34120 [soil metagenome]